MDKGTRNQIKNTVLEARRLLEADVAEQLEGIYGVARSGKAQPASTMPTLQRDPVLRHRRAQIDAVLKHDRDAGLSPKQAVARFIHETAYTALNRLVAVKMLEARGLLRRQAVAEGKGSAGFKDFQKVCPQVCQAQPDGGYQLFLELLYDELAASIRPLFDRGGPHSLIFPGWTTLDQVLALLNDSALADVWVEDETIGWVYQFFNTPDRERVRQGGRPRRPEDVAVINQFYTPRYIVEFLVDNTLG
nr:SAM-dependent methyltransferase [Anaerolineae bacterium]